MTWYLDNKWYQHGESSITNNINNILLTAFMTLYPFIVYNLTEQLNYNKIDW